MSVCKYKDPATGAWIALSGGAGGEDKLPLSGGTLSGALIMENNVPIYAGTSDGNIVLLGMMNAGDVMGIGSVSYPLAIHGSSITLDNLKVVDAAGALANLGAVPAAEKAAAGGLATLDANGKLEPAQAPASFEVIKDVSAYALSAADAGKMICFQMSSGTTTVTIPNDADMSVFPLGTEIEINKWNGGLTVNIAADDGVVIRTINNNTNHFISIDGSYGVIRLKRIAAYIWLATGDIA